MVYIEVLAIVLCSCFIQITRQRILQGSYQPLPIHDICPSEVYCHGEILEEVQMMRFFPDSKTFVDKKLLKSESDIVKRYKALKFENNGRAPNRETMGKFVNENFADDPLIEWTPSDLNDFPSVAKYTTDTTLRNWILEINKLWKLLARKVGEDAKINPDRHSSIYLPNGFFIAGGRFRELYYWDSFWIIRGALACDMVNTAKGILENFIYLVQHYGYVPNGSRVYYLKRSQPPLLIQMVSVYFKFTRDVDFIKTNIEYLETEFNFWMKNRITRVEKAGNMYLMAQYNTHTRGPRPESYYEDYTLAMNLPTDDDKDELYSRIKTGAESGWDFSTKHFNNHGTNMGNLTHTDPQNFIYVELNAILQANAEVLVDMFKMLGNADKQKYYSDIAQRFQIGIDALLWNEERGMWFDYDLTTKAARKYFYGSNFAPLWTGSYNKKLSAYYARRTLDYLIQNGYLNQDYTPKLICIPTSSIHSYQQWDYPNCWPPLQGMIIQGLYNTATAPAQLAAFNLAKSWIRTNYIGFMKNGYMFEKYSAFELGSTGGGGEYVPQTGFGWTNGLILELFWKWGEIFNSTDIKIPAALPPRT